MKLYFQLTVLALIGSAIAIDGMTREEERDQKKLDRQAANKARRMAEKEADKKKKPTERRKDRSPSPSPSSALECYRDDDCVGDDLCVTFSCHEGVCVPMGAVQCDDGDLCTTDTCDSREGCVHETITCDDKDACTINSCEHDIGCVFKDIVCDDEDNCTQDACVEGNCEFIEVVCEQGLFCHKTVCDPKDGKCVPDEHLRRDCNDHNHCTNDWCDEESEVCKHEYKNCDDGFHCTEDSCDLSTGQCVHHHKDCPIYDTMDNWKCKEAYCSEHHNGECQYKDRDCNDGDDCTQDFCSHGRCLNRFMTEDLKDKKFSSVCSKSKKAPKQGKDHAPKYQG